LRLENFARPEGPLTYAREFTRVKLSFGGHHALLESGVMAITAVSARSPFDLFPRVVLFGMCLWWCIRNRAGRVPLALVAGFGLIFVVFAYPALPVLETMATYTFPWSEKRRAAMPLGIAAALLQGIAIAGMVTAIVTSRPVRHWWAQLDGRACRRVIAGLGTTIVALVMIEALLLARHIAPRANGWNTYSASDAAAMRWLRENARPGEVLANDYMADAGMWAPYKAAMPIFAKREDFEPMQLSQLGIHCWMVVNSEHCLGGFTRDPGQNPTRLVLDEIGRLEAHPGTLQRACASGVRYVYRGAVPGPFHERHFPPPQELRQSSALEEVFRSGEAVVFRLRCPPPGG
jgi:hypothetical protein